MLKKAGVYTAKCPKCGRSILVHLASDGSVSPSECRDCYVEFAGIDNGEQRNTFVAVVKTEKSKIVVNEIAKETTKTDEKSFKTFSSTKKKAGKKSFKW